MTDPNAPMDRFAWLGNNVPPEGVVVPEDNPAPMPEEIRPPSQVVPLGVGLGIFQWLMADETERPDTLSGCRLLDTFVYLEIPREDD